MSTDDFERALRANLAEHAADAPAGEELTRRVLAGIDAAQAPTTPVTAASRPRRGRLARALVPLASAASVAAIVALVVVNGHSGGPSSSDSAGDAAGGGMGAASAASSARGVPTTFQVADLSFDSPQTGFALGTVACPAGRCPALARSTDPSTWKLVSDALPFRVGAVGVAAARTVSHIRFATATAGYAYGPNALYVTNDGGMTWTNGGSGAVALDVANGSVLRVGADGCAASCTYTLSIADAGSDDFTPVSLPGPTLVGTDVQLARAGDKAFLTVTTATGSDGAFLASADGGRTWTRRAPQPCGGRTADTPPARVISLAAAGDGSVAALCSTGAGQFTVVSSDLGVSFSRGGPINGGAAGAVALTGPEQILIGGSSVRRSTDVGRTFDAVAGLPALGSTRFLGFQNSRIGRWVGGAGTSVWTTRDGGATFTAHAFG